MAVALTFGLALGMGGAPATYAHTMTLNATAIAAGCPAPTAFTGGPRCGDGRVRLSPAEQAMLAKKQAPASEFAQVMAGKLPLATFRRDWVAFHARFGGSGFGPQAYAGIKQANVIPDTQNPPNYTITMPQQPQINNYYCGPASASEALSAVGWSVSQSTLAGSQYLRIDQNGGTNWGDNVMAPTLTDFVNILGGSYVAVNAGGGNTLTTYENDLTSDIYTGWPVVTSIAEYTGQDPHLNGHPRNVTIYHWVAVHGYQWSGGGTVYDDSIAGTRLFTWSGAVPTSSTITSSNMYTMMSQGGYGWV